jgi:dienelactone hydrolase
MSEAPCIDCFTGTVHLGTPTGTTTTIHGLPVYVAKPPEGVTPKGLIVIIPDAFGWDFVNNRLLSDHYAERGNFLVYLPDFMNGQSPSSHPLQLATHSLMHALTGSSLPFKFMELMEEKVKKPAPWFTTIFYKPFWFARALWIILPWIFKVRSSIAKPRVFNFFKAIRTSPPPFPTESLKVGAAGFCWGGYYTILLSHDEPSSRVQRHKAQTTSAAALEPLIECAFTAHPSLVTVPKDIEGVNLPLSVAVGNEDMAMKGPQILQMKEILEVKKKGDHEVVIMPGAKHGFAVRVNPKDEWQMECAEKAEVQAIDWFSKWFA